VFPWFIYILYSIHSAAYIVPSLSNTYDFKMPLCKTVNKLLFCLDDNMNKINVKIKKKMHKGSSNSI
jgi:hypothetical protein